MAIGETPSEPLTALMNTDTQKTVAKLLSGTQIFLSVSSVKISGKDFPPDRTPVPAETDGPAGFPAETSHVCAKVPGRVPAVWLTLLPSIALGTTTCRQRE